MRISHNYIFIPCFRGLPPLPSSHPLGHHRATGWDSCVIQQLPFSYVFYTWWCIYDSTVFSIVPTLSFPYCAHNSVLYVCVSIPLKLDLLKSLFSLVQSTSHVQLFATPWIAAHQASLSSNFQASNFKRHGHGLAKYMRGQGRLWGYHSDNSDPFSMKMLKKWKMVKIFYLFNLYEEYIIQNARLD